MAEQKPSEKHLSRTSLREQLGSRFQSLRALRSRDRTKSVSPASKDGPSSNHGPTVMSPRSREGGSACIFFICALWGCCNLPM